jgi:hypothetical protein
LEVDRRRSAISKFKTLSGVVAMMLCAACDSGGGGTGVRTFASPDKAYVAVLVTEIGSEAPSSSCVDTIVVVRSKDLASGRYPASSRAYFGACHTLKLTTINGQAAMPNGPQLRWTAACELSIVFDPKGARAGIRKFYSVTSLHDGDITIRYEPQ